MQTVTFYSYKGGVGRTLVVANVARYLARFGQKVFAVDFDLEAPGLHYKLGLTGKKLGAPAVERGLIDYLHSFVTGDALPKSLREYTVEIETSASAEGSIRLLPAGAAPSAGYWQKLSRLDWHELFYSEDAPGIPLFLELKERIATEFAPDFLLIDSRTGITEVGGVTTSLLADSVVCLLINNRENLEGAREVLRGIRRAVRLPDQEPVELLPVLSRVPEVGGEEEVQLIQEVREFLNEDAEDLEATLAFSEVLVLHTDPKLQLREALKIGSEERPEESPLLRDYLHLFGKLVPRKLLTAYLGPLIGQIAEKESTDPEEAEKDFEALIQYSYEPEICLELLEFDRQKKVMTSAAPTRGGATGVDATGDLNPISSFSTAEASGPVLKGWEMDEIVLTLQENASRGGHRGLRGGDSRDLSQAGWGVVFHEDTSVDVRIALQPLLAFRKAQAASYRSHYYQEFTGARGYRQGDSKRNFLLRHGVGPGQADPDKMPYYLLLVGDPEEIPFEFQHHLGLNYAVGRINFDTLEQYSRYARSVVEAETSERVIRRRATLFGVASPDDATGRIIVDQLVEPLGKNLERRLRDGWTIQSILGEEATKSRLSRLLGGDETPALLFTAGHGVLFPPGDSRQLLHQGALLCRDWPGPKVWRGKLLDDYYFAANDLPETAKLHGLIAFLFATYSAGTPRLDPSSIEPRAISPQSFVARLPTRLLDHPGGGALAVVGPTSLLWSPLESFSPLVESFLRLLMDGYPVGAAMTYFRQRNAELALDLNEEIRLHQRGQAMNDENLMSLWNAASMHFVVLGDPAVRIPS